MPVHIANDNNYTFGIKSDVLLFDQDGKKIDPYGTNRAGVYKPFNTNAGSSSMKEIIQHTEHLAHSLEKKISFSS